MPKLVNFGSLCVDWVYQVPNLVLAGETISAQSRATHPGGKGLNQSIAAALAGAKVEHFGAVGDDGGALVAALEHAGVGTDGVATIDVASGHAIIQVDGAGQNAIVIYPGANRLIPDQQQQLALGSLQGDDWLLLQNETNNIAEAITQARQLDANVAINLAPADDRIHDYPLHLVQLLIVNEAEAMALARCTDVEQAFAILTSRYPDSDIVLTQGRQGLSFAAAGSEQPIALGAYSVKAVDETAAGDAFIGFLMAGLLANKPTIDALIAASAAGALTVTKPGASTSIPSRAAVEAMVAAEALAPSAYKL